MVLGSGIRDPGSGKNLFRIPDPGVKKHPIPDPGSGSATLLGWKKFGSGIRNTAGNKKAWFKILMPKSNLLFAVLRIRIRDPGSGAF